MAAVIAITSGKGGVGKTNIAANLGVALARHAKVCVFDADTGLANINLLLKIEPEFTLKHVIHGEKTIQDVLIQAPGDIWIVPAASGVRSCVDLSEQQRKQLTEALAELERQFDYILVDTAAGCHKDVLYFVASSQYRVFVMTPEPTSLTDTFSLLKILRSYGVKRNLFVLVNRVENYRRSQKVFFCFQKAVDKYLHLKVNFLGYLVEDSALKSAVNNQKPVILARPDSSVSCCLYALADIIKKQFKNERQRPYFSHFWKKYAVPLKAEKSRHLNSDIPHEENDVQEPIARMMHMVNDETFSKQHFEDLMAQLGDVYRKRFGTGFFGDSEKLLEKIYQLLNQKNEKKRF